MDWLKSMKAPEIIKGTAGVYGLYAQSESGDKLFLSLQTVPTLGRKDGSNYNSVGLLTRLLYAGDDPKCAVGFVARDKKAYKKGDTEDDIYATQLNKMLFPIASVNVGSEAMIQLLELHFEALGEILSPLLELNGLTEAFTLASLFEAQNPGVYLPVVSFDPPTSMKTWEESVAEIKAASKQGYTPKGGFGDTPTA